MFENRKDTTLLQGAFLSAAEANSGSLFDCVALEDALGVVINSINKIVHQNSVDIKEEKVNIKAQLHIHKRLHAAVFFTTLRSHGLTFSALDTFYSSIAHVWPAVNLKFYIELNFRCDWGEYFIKCASQLPSAVLLKVFKIILDLPFSVAVKSYTWHLIVQTLILKLFEVSHDSEIESSFQIDSPGEDSPVIENQSAEITEKGEASDADLPHKKSQEEITLLKDVYKSLSDQILTEIKSNNVDLIKILLHGVKTLLKILVVEREKSYENVSKYVDFLNIFNTLNDCLKSDDCQEILKLSMSNSVLSAVKHTYATTSWNISENYLCFLISYYWNKMYSDFSFKIEISTRNFLVYSEMIINTFLYDTLNALNPLVPNSSEIDHESLSFLYKILQLDLEGASYVAEIFLSKPSLIERNETVQILEENCHAIDFIQMYPFVLQSVKAVKSQELKFRLLKIFYKLLPANNFKIYNEVLITILTEHGFTEDFQLPNFSEQLSQIFRSTPTIKQAEETFPVLFLQNPLCLLKRVIDQTLIQGPEGRSYIEPLKHVQFACTYQENKDALPALIEILNGYFERSKLMPWESKNMVTLYKFLMEIQSTMTHIMVLDVFLNSCIIPKLQYDTDKIELILECLCESITILVKNKSFLIGHESLISLIISLGKLVNDCILTQNGRLKSSVLSVIQVLDNHQIASDAIKDGDKAKLLSSFQSLNEVVCVYMKEFIPRNIDISSKSYVWVSCCYNKDSSLFDEKFPTMVLPHPTLVEVLPFLTKDEWLYSIDLLKICCKNNAVRDEILHSLNKPFHLTEYELDTYAIASCLITSLHIILQENEDPVYLISCFANSLMTILNQNMESTFLMMTILLDCCYLVECVSPDISSLITLVLLDLKKSIITSCSQKTYMNDCKKLISCAVTCLPDFCDKSVLLT